MAFVGHGNYVVVVQLVGDSKAFDIKLVYSVSLVPLNLVSCRFDFAQ
jgi:hypothetical protein